MLQELMLNGIIQNGICFNNITPHSLSSSAQAIGKWSWKINQDPAEYMHFFFLLDMARSISPVIEATVSHALDYVAMETSWCKECHGLNCPDSGSTIKMQAPEDQFVLPLPYCAPGFSRVEDVENTIMEYFDVAERVNNELTCGRKTQCYQ